MFAYLKKRKKLFLFLAVLIYSFYFIQSYKGVDFTDTLFGKIVFFIADPSQKFSNFLKNSVSSFISTNSYLKKLEQENDSLKKELAREKIRSIQNQKIKIAYQNIRKAFRFSEESEDELLLAEVVGDITNNFSKILIIDRGKKDGILKNQSVVSEDGVVGKILEVRKSTSYVQLIIDKKSYVPILLRENRDRGMLYGQGINQLVLRFISLDSGMQEGDILVTSGIAGIHNKDFPIGTVKNFNENTFFYSLEAAVEPLVNFARLEYVFVIITSSVNPNFPLFQE